MRPEVIIFDMDDVMWDLNKRVAKITGIPYEKFTCFSVYDNPNITSKERESVLTAYNRTDTYKDIIFLDPVIDLINAVYYTYQEYPVHIVSNCATEAIRNVKLPQLMSVLDLPETHIHLNVIDVKTQTKTKTLPENIFIIVDDSPHNIILAKAKHKIMPARPHNDILENGMLDGCKVDRPLDSDELTRLITHYITER